MKKSQVIGIIVLFVVLALCVGGYFIGKQYFADKEKKEEAAKKTTVVKIDPEGIVGVSYSYNGKTYTLAKKNNVWENADDKKMRIKQSDVNTMINSLQNIKATTVIKKPKDISQYGFTKTKNGIRPETQEIFVKTDKNKYYDIYVGSGNPYNTSAYYIMIEGDDNVYLVEGDIISLFQKTVNELEEETATANTKQ